MLCLFWFKKRKERRVRVRDHGWLKGLARVSGSGQRALTLIRGEAAGLSGTSASSNKHARLNSCSRRLKLPGFSPIAFGNQTISNATRSRKIRIVATETHGFAPLPRDRFALIVQSSPCKRSASLLALKRSRRPKSLNDIQLCLSTPFEISFITRNEGVIFSVSASSRWMRKP